MGDLPPPSFSVSNAFRSCDFRTSARKKSALTCWPTTDLQKRPDGTASCWPSSLRNCKSLCRKSGLSSASPVSSLATWIRSCWISPTTEPTRPTRFLQGTAGRPSRELGSHRILAGDAREEASYARLMNNEVAEMAFLDPPYDVRVAGHAGGRGRIKHEEFACASGETTCEQFVPSRRGY